MMQILMDPKFTIFVGVVVVLIIVLLVYLLPSSGGAANTGGMQADNELSQLPQSEDTDPDTQSGEKETDESEVPATEEESGVYQSAEMTTTQQFNPYQSAMSTRTGFDQISDKSRLNERMGVTDGCLKANGRGHPLYEPGSQNPHFPQMMSMNDAN